MSRPAIVRSILLAALVMAAVAGASPATALTDPRPQEIDEPARQARAPGSPAPLIVNGEALGNPGFLVFVEIELPGGFASCTGTLVDRWWVLTAAHCLDGTVSGVTVSIGADDINDGAVRAASAWIQHPGWDGRYGAVGTVDLALIRLAQPATGFPTATLNTSTTLPDLYQPLVIAGWGNVSPTGPAPDVLQVGITEATSAPDGRFDRLTCDRPGGFTSHFCFGGVTTVTACPGDSGGPLFSYRDPFTGTGAIDKVYGVVSYGEGGVFGCTPSAFDSVATSVAPHRAWIASIIDPPGDGADEMFFYRDDGLFRYYDIRPDGTIGKPILAGEGYTTGWSAITAVDLDGDTP